MESLKLPTANPTKFNLASKTYELYSIEVDNTHKQLCQTQKGKFI